LTKPHPPILIGGGGEKKTLRLVAQYAQACNLFAGPDLEHKLDVLRRHCDDVGRNYDDIEKTIMGPLDPSDPPALVEQLRGYAALGVQHIQGMVPNVADIEPLRVLGREVVPAAAEF
jgi:alkanesulfonate monooxygenase